jgi:hypothetical protein
MNGNITYELYVRLSNSKPTSMLAYYSGTVWIDWLIDLFIYLFIYL